MKKRYLSSLLLAGSILSTQLWASEIKIMTENYPPYNMEVEGELKGLAVDVLDAMLKDMGTPEVKNDIVLGAWSKAYSYAKDKKNHMVFSTTRIDEREPLFKWVGPITKSTVGVVAPKASNLKILSASDLNKYTVGAVKKGVGESLLLEQGVNKSNIKSSGGKSVVKSSYKKMEKGKIDMFAYEVTVGKYIANENGFDTSKYETVYILKEGELYFAFNKETDDAIIQKWQKSLDTIKANGEYDKIISKY